MNNCITQDICDCYCTSPLSQCLESIIIPQLETDTNYLFELTDKFNNREVLVASTTSTEYELLLSEFTKGITYDATLILKVYSTSDYNTPIEFTFNDVTYPCLLLNFINSNDTNNELR
jgi:hypothetical protein